MQYPSLPSLPAFGSAPLGASSAAQSLVLQRRKKLWRTFCSQTTVQNPAMSIHRPTPGPRTPRRKQPDAGMGALAQNHGFCHPAKPTPSCWHSPGDAHRLAHEAAGNAFEFAQQALTHGPGVHPNCLLQDAELEIDYKCKVHAAPNWYVAD